MTENQNHNPSNPTLAEDTSYTQKKAVAAGLAPTNLEGYNKSEKRQNKVLSSQKTSLQQNKIEAGDYSAQHLELPRELYAGFWIRMLAFAVDFIFIFLINHIIFGLINYFTGNLDFGTSLWAHFLRLLVYCSYFALTTFWFKGQTPGKMLFNLRVVSTAEEHLSGETILIREFFGRIIFYYAAWIMVVLIFTDKKQHLIDLLTDTVVIQEKYLSAFIKWQAL